MQHTSRALTCIRLHSHLEHLAIALRRGGVLCLTVNSVFGMGYANMCCEVKMFVCQSQSNKLNRYLSILLAHCLFVLLHLKPDFIC